VRAVRVVAISLFVGWSRQRAVTPDAVAGKAPPNRKRAADYSLRCAFQVIDAIHRLRLSRSKPCPELCPEVPKYDGTSEHFCDSNMALQSQYQCHMGNYGTEGREFESLRARSFSRVIFLVL
jgi:hypothetical protein